jgi:hypothetical protein
VSWLPKRLYVILVLIFYCFALVFAEGSTKRTSMESEDAVEQDIIIENENENALEGVGIDELVVSEPQEIITELSFQSNISDFYPITILQNESLGLASGSILVTELSSMIQDVESAVREDGDEIEREESSIKSIEIIIESGNVRFILPELETAFTLRIGDLVLTGAAPIDILVFEEEPELWSIFLLEGNLSTTEGITISKGQYWDSLSAEIIYVGPNIERQLVAKFDSGRADD